jgi:hypothetical protein
MASILELLDETMLASADRGQKVHNGQPSAGKREWYWAEWPKGPSKPQPTIEVVSDLEGSVAVVEIPPNKKTAPIWHYTEPAINDGKVRVENLTCLVSGMDYMQHTVCESIEWCPVSFRAEGFGSGGNLPLGEEYLIRRGFSKEGSLDGTDRLWKLPLKTDISFEFVFGYQFPWQPQTGSWSATPEPLKNVSPEPAGFVESLRAPFGGATACVTLHAPECPGANTFRYSPPQIIVVVTLICCKEADYGLLNAGRFFPMIMVASNIELTTVDGAIQLTRPKKANMRPMAGEQMTADIGAILFTDRNEQDGMFPSVTWDQSFEYYDLDPTAGGSYVIAHPQTDIKKGARTIVGVKVKSYDVCDEIRGDFDLRRTADVKTRYVNKEARQGEFDNIHISPKMTLQKSQLKSDYGPSIDDLAPTFENITMAPFCVHDCLHMHVRWATWPGKDRWDDPTAFAPVNFRGWDGDSSPNALPGVPIVPANQKVTLNLKSPFAFEYVAEAQNAKPGKWQIMMHHGASYSLSGIWRGEGAELVSPSSGVALRGLCPPFSDGSWAMMYWNLRWVIGTDDLLHERLSGVSGPFTAEDLAKLREVN